ncbi:MAG: carbohydrate ABC transporter permease [Chloroflexi bacterium]|nr:MAG: carbohydrate ABC transporter permease [Chloroflexota bacterium]
MSEYQVSQERRIALESGKTKKRAIKINETHFYRGLRVVGLAFFTFLVLFPLYTVVTTSIKPLQDVQSAFHWIPSHVTFAPYGDIWQTVPLARYFINSVVISGSATLISVAIAILAGYALTTYRIPGRRVFSLVVLSTQMFPGILFMLPLFIIFINIQQVIGVQLYGSYLGLIITYLTFSLPVAIWMLAGYFDSLPKGLEEAAGIDGASPLGTLVRIIIPISMPGIVAVAIYSFMTAWNELLFASILTTDTTRTLAVGLQGYATQSNVYWNQLMAASIVVSIPVVIGFLALQKYMVQGMTAGAVK